VSDKLDWLHKHLVLLRYITLKDVVAQENYKIRPDLAELYEGIGSAETMAFKFAEQDKFKDACELLAYICHRRAGVWWVYRCVNSLAEELQTNPAKDRDIADIGSSFEVTVPDWAKIKVPEPDPKLQSVLDARIQESLANHEKMRALADPEMLDLVESSLEVAYQEFKRVHGIHPIDLLKKLGERLVENPYDVDPKSPVFAESAKLKAQLVALQKETVDTIKSVIPPKVPAHEKKMRDKALSAVYRWVAAPDAENSQKCLDIGNECPDTPAGLLSLSAFWAFGDLMPMGKQPVPTPPGLAANGLSQVLLMCALHKGGTRKVKERYEHYFDLGIDVLTGKDNWEENLAEGKAPHEKPQAPERPVPPPQIEGKTHENSGYHRWKMEPPPE
jgi:hypothetical protein